MKNHKLYTFKSLWTLEEPTLSNWTRHSHTVLPKVIKIAATSVSSGLFIPIPPGLLNQETTQGLPSIERTVTAQYQELSGAWQNSGSLTHICRSWKQPDSQISSATLQPHSCSLTNICCYCDLLVLVQSKRPTTRSSQIYEGLACSSTSAHYFHRFNSNERMASPKIISRKFYISWSKWHSKRQPFQWAAGNSQHEKK